MNNMTISKHNQIWLKQINSDKRATGLDMQIEIKRGTIEVSVIKLREHGPEIIARSHPNNLNNAIDAVREAYSIRQLEVAIFPKSELK